jgi:hypothetical protein
VRRQPLLLWLSGLCLAVAGTPLARGDEPPAAVLSAERLKARILEDQRKIRSYYIVYETDRNAQPASGEPPDGYIRRIVVAKAPDRMYYVNAHALAGIDWQEYPALERWYLTGQGWFSEHPVNRTFTAGGPLRPKDELPGPITEDLFFATTGVWLFEQRAPRWQGVPIALRDVAASPAYSAVRPRQELVDGHWCHVLEHEGVDRLWIDLEHGCALLARETDQGTPPVLTQRMEAGGHREVAPGVWLPSWMRTIQYNWRARTEAKRKERWKDTRVGVLEARANDVDDSLFEFRPPPGALDLSRAKEPVQTEPGGLDHLENLGAWIGRHYQATVAPEPEVEGYLAGLPVLGFIAAFELWLYWTRNRAAPAGAKHGDLEKRAVP